MYVFKPADSERHILPAVAIAFGKGDKVLARIHAIYHIPARSELYCRLASATADFQQA
jgi:hypothetical protein